MTPSKRRVLLSLAGIFLVGCTGVAVEQGTPKADPRKAIEASVREYLVAVAHNDYATRARGTVGELQEWNSWIEAAGYVRGVEKAELEINELKVARVAESEATVDLQATLRFTTGRQVRLSGPVVLMRNFLDWRIVDYRRDGRSQRRAVVNRVQGEVTVDGLTVKAVGWVLQEHYVDVFVRVVTTKYGTLKPLQPSLRDGSGRILRHGTVGPTTDGVMSVHIEGTGRAHRTPGTYGNQRVLEMDQGVAVMLDYYWADRELDVGTKEIDLLLGFQTSAPSKRLKVALAIRAPGK